MLSIEELLKPRYKVVADYPKSIFNVGDIINAGTTGEDCIYCDREGPRMRHYPHLFQPLPWWSYRKVEDMPTYVKITTVPFLVERKVAIGDIIKVHKHFTDLSGNYNGSGCQPFGNDFLLYQNCEPASVEDYNAYLQTTTQLKK